jgi:O-antigen ligase
MLLFKKDIFLKYLIYLIPFALILSIFFTEIILILILLFYFHEVRTRNKFELIFLKNAYFNFFLIIYFLYVSLNSIFLEESFFLRNTIFYLRFYFYFISLLYFIQKLNIYFIFLKSFFIASLILSIDTIIQFIFGFNIIGIPVIVENRISSFFGDELVLGSYIVRLAPFSLIFLFMIKVNVLLKFFYLLILFFTVILSGERTALFLFFLGLFVIFISIKGLRVPILGMIIFSLLSMSFLINFNKSYYERYYYNVLNSFGFHKSKVENDKKIKFSIFDSKGNSNLVFFSRHHQDHYESAYKIFQKNPIRGGGTKSFRYLCNKMEFKISESSCSTHPHNILMQFLSELGLVGFSFLVIFYILIGRELVNILKFNCNKEGYMFLIFSLSGLIINLFPFIPSGNFFNNWLSIIFTLNLVNYIYLRQKYLND